MKINKFKIILLMMVVVSFNSSCSNDENLKTNHLETTCIIDSKPEDFSSVNCAESALDTSYFCERIVVEEIFEFTVDERKWMPYFCCEIGEEIYFEDKDGNETTFILEDKNRGIYTTGFNGFDDCDSLSAKHRVYCVNREIISTRFYADILRHELKLSLSVEFDRPFKLPLETGVILEIRGNNVNHLTAFVEEGELDNIQAGNLIYYDELKLLGKGFSNVHTFRNVIDSNYIEIFYNKEFGIIGFEDYNETLWVKKD